MKRLGEKSWYVLAITVFELFKKFCFEVFLKYSEVFYLHSFNHFIDKVLIIPYVL